MTKEIKVKIFDDKGFYKVKKYDSEEEAKEELSYIRLNDVSYKRAEMSIKTYLSNGKEDSWSTYFIY